LRTAKRACKCQQIAQPVLNIRIPQSANQADSTDLLGRFPFRFTDTL
jgi:hypothetical protein